MGEPGETLEGSIDSEGDDRELLRGLEAALGHDDDRNSGVDRAVPGLFDSHGSLSGHQGGVAESSAAKAATRKDEAEVALAREAQQLPSSTPRVELANKGVKALRNPKDPTDSEATPERRVSARVGSPLMPTDLRANFGAGSSDDYLRNAGGGPCRCS